MMVLALPPNELNSGRFTIQGLNSRMKPELWVCSSGPEGPCTSHGLKENALIKGLLAASNRKLELLGKRGVSCNPIPGVQPGLRGSGTGKLGTSFEPYLLKT